MTHTHTHFSRQLLFWNEQVETAVFPWLCSSSCRHGQQTVAEWVACVENADRRDDVLVCEVARTHSGLGGRGGGVWCLVVRGGGDLGRQPGPWSIQPPTNHMPQHSGEVGYMRLIKRRMVESIKWVWGLLRPVKLESCAWEKNWFKKQKSEPIAFVKSADERKYILTDSSSINWMSYISQFSKKIKCGVSDGWRQPFKWQEAATDGAQKQTWQWLD